MSGRTLGPLDPDLWEAAVDQPRTVAAVDVAIAKTSRERANTLAAIERKLHEVANLRTVYATQGAHLDRLLEERTTADLHHTLHTLTAAPDPAGQEPTRPPATGSPGPTYTTGGTGTPPHRPRPTHL